MKKLICASTYAVCMLLFSNGANAAKQPSLNMPDGFGKLFQFDGTWSGRTSGTIVGTKGNAAGWLTVHDENGKKLGEVLVHLSGRSFYDPAIAHDYTVRYVAWDLSGVQENLPRGLYAWRGAVHNGTSSISVRPAADHKYHQFKYCKDSGEPGWYSGKHRTHFWDPKKATHVHPSREISDILAKLAK